MMIYKIIFPKLFILALLCFGYAEIISPIQGDSLNYRQIVIEWEQEPSAIAYNIQLYEDHELVLDTIDSSLVHIINESIINWDQSYIIYLRSILSDGSYSSIIDSSIFSIYNIPEDYSNSYIETNTFIEDQYHPGVTFLQKTAINKEGENIFFWSTPYIDHDGMNFTFSNLLDNGNLIGWIISSSETSLNAGVEIDFNGDIHWSTDEPVHHDLFPMPNGNYMGLVKEVFYAPPPNGPWLADFEEYGITNIQWLGDKIIEWNSEGEIIWSWKTTDYISLEEFDPVWMDGFQLDDIMFGIEGFDWTHSNAVFYNEVDNAVYLSVRHLSRIIKIDYNTGNIIWNMGKEFLPDIIDFGQNLEFSYQHAIRVLDNQNLMMYDNGNQNNPQVSRCIEIEVDENESNAQIVWEYILPDSVFTASMGECDRLDNGNTLITAGRANYLLEIDDQNNPVWEINTEDPFYRSDRIPSLYPLLFSVEVPNFTNTTSHPMVYLPLGSSVFELTITNEGYLDFDFMYTINEDLNWYQESTGVINIPSNNTYTVSIPITINNSASDNTINISVCPLSDYDVECKTIVLNANTCETNPNYYFSDMSICPDLMHGDINQDMVVDILDVIVMVDIIMGDIDPADYIILLSDINQDDNIDIFDVIHVINIILS